MTHTYQQHIPLTDTSIPQHRNFTRRGNDFKFSPPFLIYPQRTSCTSCATPIILGVRLYTITSHHRRKLFSIETANNLSQELVPFHLTITPNVETRHQCQDTYNRIVHRTYTHTHTQTYTTTCRELLARKKRIRQSHRHIHFAILPLSR